MKSKTIALLILPLFYLVSCSEQPREKFILNENFDSNKIGWTEEFTKAHESEIKDGFLYIYSLDTSKAQSSNGPRNISFLWGFPGSYEITTSLQSIEHSGPTSFGILLISASVEYRFSLSDSGVAKISEFDYNRNSEVELISKKYSEDIDATHELTVIKINVTNRKFYFYVNNELIGHGLLKTKSWEGVRLFTTSGSAIKVDYLRITRGLYD